MILSAADKLALKDELTTDPKSLGLDVLPEHDAQNASLLNAVSEALVIRKRSLSTADVFNAIAPLEHQALTDQQARYVSAVLVLGQIDPFRSTNIVAGLDGMFSAETASRPAIDALLTEPGNRIDQMYQEGLLSTGGTVTPSNIADARQP